MGYYHAVLGSLLILLSPLVSYADQGTGTIAVYVKYSNGDKAGFWALNAKVYQDFSSTPYKIIDSFTSNPYNISSLPLEHHYSVEVYLNRMYATVGYLDLNTAQQELDLAAPLPGGMRFHVFYNDGYTPIQNATISVGTPDGKFSSVDQTDLVGQTLRFWIEPTIRATDYYNANVTVSKDLVFPYSPVKLAPSALEEISVVTPWPPVNGLVTVDLFKTYSNKVTESDGNFVVDLYDDKGQKVDESSVDYRGEAFFSNIKVGDYTFRAFNLNDHLEWGNSNATISGPATVIQIFQNNQSYNTSSIVIPLWVKNTAMWWSHDQIDDSDFIKGIQFLIQNGIMKIPQTHSYHPPSNQIPSWIKITAGWWATGKISDEDFVKGIQFLIQNGIMKI